MRHFILAQIRSLREMPLNEALYDMNSELVNSIKACFPEIETEPLVSSEFVVENQCIFDFESNGKELKLVPSYMLWCINAEDKLLVDHHLIHVLAEYGRAKHDGPEWLRFMHQCNREQVKVVLTFLRWCESNLLVVDEKQLRRAIQNWEQHVI